MKQSEDVCPECNGWGVVSVINEVADDDYSSIEEEDICPVCNGDGVAY